MLPDYRFMIAALIATVVFVVLSFQLLAIVRFGHLPSTIAIVEHRRFADERSLFQLPLVQTEQPAAQTVASDTSNEPQISSDERVQLANLIALTAGVTPKERSATAARNDSSVTMAAVPVERSQPLEPEPAPIGGPLIEPTMTGSIGPKVPVPRSAAEVRRELDLTEERKRRARALAAQRARLLATQRAKAKEAAEAAQNPFTALFGGGAGN